MLELWGMQRMVAPDRFLFMGKIEVFNIETVLTLN